MRIAFDMDGTIANLYGVNNWLADLIAEFYRPEFAYDSEGADTIRHIADARTVVTQWN